MRKFLLIALLMVVNIQSSHAFIMTNDSIITDYGTIHLSNLASLPRQITQLKICLAGSMVVLAALVYQQWHINKQLKTLNK
jgi:hypothetical protein